jgi:hypothetical protein
MVIERADYHPARARDGVATTGLSRSRISRWSRLQALDEVRRALRVASCGEDRAMVCLEHVQPVGNVGRVVLARLKRQIQVGAEERSAEFGHEFFHRVAFGPETLAAEVARQA